MAKETDAQKVEVPSAESIAAAAQEGAKGGMPPVDKWNPPFCGDLDMRIARDGTWFYLGTPIGRPGLVKLFSSIIRKDGDDYFLVTPVEKVGITVDDAPFVALDFNVTEEAEDQKLHFETHVGDTFVAGPEHSIRVAYDDDGEPSPYVLVRRNLEALIDRKSFYRLVDLGVHRDGWFGVWSDGEFFPIIRSEALET
ncbi:hypothetical protein BCF46_1811 [Litoreibacter meonggei]|uniref:Proteophosphoglycan n=1 Tax=Litoreibacter meonggei TaxID=1049199 RepID=A0A497W8S7_9RHOB|nr:DUF1285 domain-containing protein [Litoreibacter meonggei]RLJ51597.1 hypothetical protein BCF46_1811 [Litoreibacter meonggei]